MKNYLFAEFAAVYRLQIWAFPSQTKCNVLNHPTGTLIQAFIFRSI